MHARRRRAQPPYFVMSSGDDPMDMTMESLAGQCERWGDAAGAVIARARLSQEQMQKLLAEMRRRDEPMDAKTLEEEIRKVGGTVVEPAALGAKSKKTTKRKSPEVIEIQDSSDEKASSSDDEDEKPSPAKKAKAAHADPMWARMMGGMATVMEQRPGGADSAAFIRACAVQPLSEQKIDELKEALSMKTQLIEQQRQAIAKAGARALEPAKDPEEDAELICRPKKTGKSC